MEFERVSKGNKFLVEIVRGLRKTLFKTTEVYSTQNLGRLKQ